MKAKPASLVGSVQRAGAACRIFYFCGPDEAGASDAANRVAALVAPGSERIELAGADLRRDPVLLGDQALSQSLFGGERHILVRGTGDEMADAVEVLLEVDGTPCPVLIVASGATDKSRTAKLLEPRADAIVTMFYQPELGTITAAVRAMGDAAGLRMGADIAQRIARAAALDLRLAQSEVTKLAVYLDASPQVPRRADAEALDAIGAPSDDDSFAPLVNVVLNGEFNRLSGEILRLRELSLNPVGVLLALERRAAQLAELSARLGKRSDIAGFLEEEARARRVFFREQADLGTQLRRWRGNRLERLIARLAELHARLLAASQNAELLLSQGLAEIARAAAQRPI